MKTLTFALVLAAALPFARGQVAVTANPDQAAMVASADAGLAANKRLVYDFWREVFEGGHMERVDAYLAEGYIQHNPMVPTGRAAFVEAFSKRARPVAIEARIKAPLVSLTAEGDLVTLAFVREYDDPREPGKKYTTTWFDMFRLENGRIAEHWDSATRR